MIVGLVVVLQGSDGGASNVSAPDGKGSVDISGLDDPTTTRRPETTTTTDAAATTTVVTADGRILVESERGITWTMAVAPEIAAATAGRTWTAVDGDTTETVSIYPATSSTDVGALLADQATAEGGVLSKVLDSHIAEADGQTASFEGTAADGEAVVGYLVGAVVGDQVVIAETSRIGASLDELYLDFLNLPASFDLGR